MSFDQSLAAHFPGAMPLVGFVGRSHSALYRLGFQRGNTLIGVILCRDELTAPLRRELYATWGDGFDGSSLAALPTFGRTGLVAAVDHAPIRDGRTRLVWFAFPHIAIARDGAIGPCARPGRDAPSSACGALELIRRELAEGSFDPTFHSDFIEYTLLKARLAPRVGSVPPPDLATLTRLLHKVIVEDLTRQLTQVHDETGGDHALVTGILIHGPDGHDHVWPGPSYAVVRGDRTTLAVE